VGEACSKRCNKELREGEWFMVWGWPWRDGHAIGIEFLYMMAYFMFHTVHKGLFPKPKKP
jgi:hypothetical protein